eukprot:gene1181-1334_t
MINRSTSSDNLKLDEQMERQWDGVGELAGVETDSENPLQEPSYSDGVPTTMDTEWVAIPYPSSYHFPREWNYQEWILGNYKDRNVTVSFVGSTLGPHRAVLKQLCEEASPSVCLWLETAPSRPYTSSMLSVYRKSVFCLMPLGHTWSRKAALDALLSGCIPVVFNLQTLHTLMPWDIDLVTASAASVFFPLDQLMDPCPEGNVDGDVEACGLSTFHPKKDCPLLPWQHTIRDGDEIHLKRRVIAAIAPRLQYSLPVTQTI